ncbi:IS1 family transposase [Adhaeribacter sp. BT258]|uniref:IS1 family transposase n=1 Tax=Adhaeribacter terrigena TaxID=2793070 RepID=A0ABS1C0J7_9BACT|nr:IS1 family transposase [Adhaeribacter terrigena]MBK0402902.1 IS1 family transposase [Adhaeribacter terrigena]
MESKLVCAASYLSYEEGILLFNDLEEAGIPALVKSCGPPSIPFGEGQFFQLLVAEENQETATGIAEKFRHEVAVARLMLKCPGCRSEAVLKVKTLPFWQKIYFAGTQVFKCESCGKKFAG